MLYTLIPLLAPKVDHKSVTRDFTKLYLQDRCSTSKSFSLNAYCVVSFHFMIYYVICFACFNISKYIIPPCIYLLLGNSVAAH